MVANPGAALGKADFEAFAKDRPLPVVKGELGMTGDPDVEIRPLQSVFLAAAANA